MAIQTLSTIKSWFKTGERPTQARFGDTWDSFRHKLEKIPMSAIEDLENIINDKVSAGELNNHSNNPLAHADLFDKKADAEALKEHMEGGQAHDELFEQKVDKKDGMGLSEEDFTTELKEKLEGLGDHVEIPTLDAVLTAGNSSFKSIVLNDVSSSAQKSTISSSGLLVNTTASNGTGRYAWDTIKFSAVNGGGSVSLKADSFLISGNHTQNIQNKSGTIALLEDIPTGNPEPMPKKAIFNITFEIDEDGNKTFNHEPLYNNAGELVLKGAFIATPENENNIRLLLSLQFPEVYAKAVCMQENINLNHTTTTPDSIFFYSLLFMVEKSDKGILELITPPSMFVWSAGKSKKLTFTTEFLLVE